MMLATFVIAAGLMWLRLVAGPTVSVGQMLGPNLVLGLGAGLAFSQVQNIVLSSVRAKEQGEASGLQTASQDLGFGLGPAVVGSLFLALIAGEGAFPAVLIVLLAVLAAAFVVAWQLPDQ